MTSPSPRPQPYRYGDLLRTGPYILQVLSLEPAVDERGTLISGVFVAVPRDRLEHYGEHAVIFFDEVDGRVLKH